MESNNGGANKGKGQRNKLSDDKNRRLLTQAERLRWRAALADQKAVREYTKQKKKNNDELNLPYINAEENKLAPKREGPGRLMEEAKAVLEARRRKKEERELDKVKKDKKNELLEKNRKARRSKTSKRRDGTFNLGGYSKHLYSKLLSKK